jgi:hypothetical protein
MNDHTIEQIARVAHHVNRAYCQAMGDNSQPEWEDAPDWQRESAISGVELHLQNPNMTPEMSHSAWMKVKRADGWSYGAEKDPDNKTHPCMVPYDELPVQQRAKDYLFKAVVEALAEHPPTP